MVEIVNQYGEIISSSSANAGDGSPIVVDNIQLFDFSINLLSALLWQHNDAVNLQSLMQQKQSWYEENQTKFWQDWLVNVFDLRTANQFGIVVWSIILDFPLYINLAPAGDYENWGFGDNNQNFGNGNFASANGTSIQLPLETQRLALQLRYFQLCNSGTVPEINRFMNFVFNQFNGSPDGTVYLQDNNNMTQIYKFNFVLSWDLVFLLQNYDILPRPCGVAQTYIDATSKTFGFGKDRVNFSGGNFYSPTFTYGLPGS